MSKATKRGIIATEMPISTLHAESRTGATGTLLERIRSGDVRALARAISLVENENAAAWELLSACFPYTGRALRIGLTGAPGAGKSTLVDQLVLHYRAHQQTVGVVAVDPTSPYTGGAILGDRIRMQHHSADPGLYIRSMATRGHLGGLARATADVASVVEASGKDRLLIETVGVGQDEVDIVRLADVTVVVLVPGLGDDVQSLKAGLMEIADIFVINKSDREGADRLEREVRTMQSLGKQNKDQMPPILRTVASAGEGIEGLAAAIEKRRLALEENGQLKEKRAGGWRVRLLDLVRQQLVRELVEHRLGSTQLEAHAQAIAEGKEDPYTLAETLWRGLLAPAAKAHPDDRRK